jgi:glycosyltransferase involved in cell wall biosynthesis
VAGEAALFADPGFPKDFSEQMMRILEDEKLQKSLRAQSQLQLKKFSWEKAAQVLAFEFRESSLNSKK